MPRKLTKPFILILVFLVIVGCFLVFKPFIPEIFMAAVMATIFYKPYLACLLYTTDAADEGLGVDLGGRSIIKKK